MGIQHKAKEIADKSSDAYSSGRYVSWYGCALSLLKRGYSDKEVEAILRSKWMRWAGDSSDKPFGRYTSGDIIRFIDDPRNRIDKEEVRRLTEETFG